MIRKVAVTTVVGGAATYAFILDDKQQSEAQHVLDGGVRFLRTMSNAALTAADYKMNLPTDKASPDYKSTLSEINLRAASRLLAVCRKNGGLYTKFGQNVANMNNVLPKEFTETLAPLQDKATPIPADEALAAVEKQLGVPWDHVFSEFDKEAAAAASLAQVHKAVLKTTGETVAVKLQYPGLQNQVKGDLTTLKFLTDIVGYLFPGFSYSWMTPEFENNMTLELDFLQEARNSERLGRLFHNRGDVYVPKIVWELTTEHLLVMEFIDGIKVNDIPKLMDSNISPLNVASTISAIFGDMIHLHGFVHCDPHQPGNLMVRHTPPSNSIWSQLDFAVSSLCLGTIPVAMAIGAFAGPGSTIAVAVTVGAIGANALSEISHWAFGSTKKSSFSQGSGSAFQVVILDHGMYRRLDPAFRLAYCGLWQALLLRDEKLGKKVSMQMGISPDQYEVLSLVFTYRGVDSTHKTGERMNKESRGRVRERYKDVTAGDINQFLQDLPRDLLFVMRSTNIVRAINLSLGGTSRDRFKTMGESAVRGILVKNPPQDTFDRFCELHPEVDYSSAYVLNLPVSSEVTNVDAVTWRQQFEVWRLQTYLNLIDSSWKIIAYFVKAI